MVLGGIIIIIIRSYMDYIGEGLQKLLDRGVWGNKVLSRDDFKDENLF